jgi:hypothetical protein
MLLCSVLPCLNFFAGSATGRKQRSQQSWLPTNNPGLVVSCRLGLRGPPAPPPAQEQEGRRQLVAAETVVDAVARR